MLPRDKADKARRFAYSLVSKKLACGIAASLTKHELAKQLIHHAATWKPTKLGSISREKEIDTALSVAWRAIVAGTWQVPLELARAQMLQYEFEAYRRKYQESGIVAYEVSALELDVNKMLGGWCDLKGKITDGVKVNGDAVRSRFNTWGSDTEIYDNQQLGSESHKPDMLNINPLNKEMIINKDYLLSQGIEEHNNYELIQDLAKEPDKQNDYLIDYDYPEIGRCNRRSFDLSHIPEQQKYLKVTPSDTKGDDSILLETTSGKEYCVRLKELEMNNEGEFVMTLKPVKTNLFLEQLSKETSYLELRGDTASDVHKVPRLEFIESRIGKQLSLEKLEQAAGEEKDDFGLIVAKVRNTTQDFLQTLYAER